MEHMYKKGRTNRAYLKEKETMLLTETESHAISRCICRTNW